MTRTPFFHTNIARVLRMHREIGVAAITATAVVITNQAKRNARGGFKSGRFVTQGWTLIAYEVLDKDTMKPRARVGSPLKHFMWWELGHHNAWTGKYERSPWLAPAFQNGRMLQVQAARDAAEQIARRYMLPGVVGRMAISVGRGASRGPRPLPG